MITSVRTAIAMPGKIPELISLAKEISAIYKRLNGRDLVVGLAVGGNGSEISWVAHPDSLAAYEEAMPKMLADAEYRGLLKKLEPLLVPGSVRDQIWRSV